MYLPVLLLLSSTSSCRYIEQLKLYHHTHVKNKFSFQAWELWKDRRWNEFIDQSFGDDYELEELMKYLVVALLCVQEKTVDHPTIPDVVAVLISDSVTLPEPKQPAYSLLVGGAAGESRGSELMRRLGNSSLLPK